jgi:PAS domain-containing protein
MPVLAPDDVRRLMERSSGRGHTERRNRALVAAFAGAGLGVAETLTLVEADLDATSPSVRVAGQRSRTVAVEPAVMATLIEWAAERRGLGLAGGPLFCTRDGLPLEASYVRRLIARLGREAGIEAVVNARSLRESYAAARIAAGATAEQLKAELGHTSIASTQRFVRHLGEAPPEPGLPADVTGALLGVAHCGLTVLRAQRNGAGMIRDFVIEYANPAAAALLGHPEQELVGASVSACFPNAPRDGTYERWIDLIEAQTLAGQESFQESVAGARALRVRRLAIGDRILMSVEDKGAARGVASALALLDTAGPGAPAAARQAS